MVQRTANLDGAISILLTRLQDMTRAFPINDQNMTRLANHLPITRYFNGKITLVENVKNFVLPARPRFALIAMAVLLIPPYLVVNLLVDEFSYALRVLYDLRVSTSALGHDLITYLDSLVGTMSFGSK